MNYLLLIAVFVGVTYGQNPSGNPLIDVQFGADAVHQLYEGTFDNVRFYVADILRSQNQALLEEALTVISSWDEAATVINGDLTSISCGCSSGCGAVSQITPGCGCGNCGSATQGSTCGCNGGCGSAQATTGCGCGNCGAAAQESTTSCGCGNCGAAAQESTPSCGCNGGCGAAAQESTPSCGCNGGCGATAPTQGSTPSCGCTGGCGCSGGCGGCGCNSAQNGQAGDCGVALVEGEEDVGAVVVEGTENDDQKPVESRQCGCGNCGAAAQESTPSCGCNGGCGAAAQESIPSCGCNGGCGAAAQESAPSCGCNGGCGAVAQRIPCGCGGVPPLATLEEHLIGRTSAFNSEAIGNGVRFCISSVATTLRNRVNAIFEEIELGRHTSTMLQFKALAGLNDFNLLLNFDTFYDSMEQRVWQFYNFLIYEIDPRLEILVGELEYNEEMLVVQLRGCLNGLKK